MTATLTVPVIGPAPIKRDRCGHIAARMEFHPGTPAAFLLDCGEIALALYHCGTPLHMRDSADTLATRVLDAVTALGLPQLREMAEDSHAINVRSVHHRPRPGDDRAFTALWPRGGACSIGVSRLLTITLLDASQGQEVSR